MRLLAVTSAASTLPVATSCPRKYRLSYNTRTLEPSGSLSKLILSAKISLSVMRTSIGTPACPNAPDTEDVITTERSEGRVVVSPSVLRICHLPSAYSIATRLRSPSSSLKNWMSVTFWFSSMRALTILPSLSFNAFRLIGLCCTKSWIFCSLTPMRANTIGSVSPSCTSSSRQ